MQSCLSSLTDAHKSLGLSLPRYVCRSSSSIPSPMEQSQQRQRSVLVTGGAGFIGTHTVLQLLKEGFLVTIIDNLDNSVPDAVDRVRLLAGPKLSQNLRFFIVIYLFLIPPYCSCSSLSAARVLTSVCTLVLRTGRSEEQRRPGESFLRHQVGIFYSLQISSPTFFMLLSFTIITVHVSFLMIHEWGFQVIPVSFTDAEFSSNLSTSTLVCCDVVEGK